MKYDLKWGDSIAVRQEFVKGVSPRFQQDIRKELLSSNYTPFEGDEQLLKHTKEVIKRQIGLDYEHIILTNGAAGGCVLAMRAYQLQGREIAVTHEAPYFSLYPSMIEASGLRHQILGYSDPKSSVFLVDSPSNPEGTERESNRSSLMPVIWDAVYANNIYSNITRVIPHNVLVGSYSKLTGLNGIRIGWIATNDYLLYIRMAKLVAAEYCGLSAASQNCLNMVLPDYNWDLFEFRARHALDYNRMEWSKLERFLGNAAVPSEGMFHYAPMDTKCQELFRKAGIIWTPSTALGTFHNDHGRFNLGQSADVIKDAVAQVLKLDRLS